MEGHCEIPADGSDISPEPHIYRTQDPSTGPRVRPRASPPHYSELRPSARVVIRSDSALTHAMNTDQDAFFFDGGRDFFFFDEPPPPFRRRWMKRARTATKAAATKDAPMARWCFTMPVSSGMRGTSPASRSCVRA